MLEVELRREVFAPRAARALLTERFGGSLPCEDLYTAKLLVSELVTNAVVHGIGKITLRLDLDERRLFVEVADEGKGFEPPSDSGASGTALNGGRGLFIVDTQSSRWGIHEGTAHVWFELEQPVRGSSTAGCLQRTPRVCSALRGPPGGRESPIL